MKRISIFIETNKGIARRTILRKNLKNYKVVGNYAGRRIWQKSLHQAIRRFTTKKGKTLDNRRYTIYQFPLYKKFVNEEILDDFIAKLKSTYNVVRNKDKKYIAQRLVLRLSFDRNLSFVKIKNKKTGRLRKVKDLIEVGTSYYERDDLSTIAMFDRLREILSFNNFDNSPSISNYSSILEEGEELPDYFYAIYFVVQFTENYAGAI